jgi:ankyrin repeat protein
VYTLNLKFCTSSVNEMTTGGQTSLHLAAESNLSEVCSILLANGVDYSAVDSRGNNALHLAVKEGHIAVTRVLVIQSVCGYLHQIFFSYWT